MSTEPAAALDDTEAADGSERAVSERSVSRRRLDVELAVWARRHATRDRAMGGSHFATLERMEQAYGQRFDDVEIHADSTEVPVGQ